MPEKRNSPKKKAKAPAARSLAGVASSKAKAPKRETAFYVSAPELSVIVSIQKPEGTASQFATFDEAKEAAIDALIQAIEDAEAQLLALKRAGDYDQWRAAGGT